MQRLFIRIGLTIVTLAATIGIAASSATAAAVIPSGVGWSGSWSYSSSTALSVHVKVPGASVSATGTDVNGTRTFSVSLSDLDGSDGKCATIDWETDSFDMQALTCVGTITFTPPVSDSRVVVTVCRKVPHATAPINCNPLEVPSSLQYPFVRAAGNGFNWAYAAATDPNGDLNDWVANLNIGSMNFAYYGRDNFGGAGNRWIRSWLTLRNQSATCGSATISGGDIPSSVSMCNGPKVEQLPTPNTTGVVSGQGCVWTPLIIIPTGPNVRSQSITPVVHDCLTVMVTVPS